MHSRELKIAPVVEKMTETCLRQFGHVKRPIDSPARKVDLLKDSLLKDVEEGSGKPWENSIKKIILKLFY